MHLRVFPRTALAIALAALLHLAPRASAEEPFTEAADNTSSANAQALPDSTTIDIKPRKSDHYFKLVVPHHTVYRLSLSFEEAARNPTGGRLFISDWATNKDLYNYPFRVLDQHYRAGNKSMLFFPVLDAGNYYFQIRLDADEKLDGMLHLKWEPLDPKTMPLTDAEKSRARDLLGNTLQFLLNGKPEKDTNGYYRATEALALAALAEGSDGAARRDILDKTYLPLINKWMQDIDKVKTADGKPVRAASTRLYEASIVALATAEVAGQGDAQARSLCEENARYLLLTQLGPRRPPEWKPRQPPAPGMLGGWRYERDARDADISVTGWCAIALIAADAAGIHLPPTRDALQDVSTFLSHCTYNDHFVYQPDNHDNPGNIHSAIGALLLLLDAQDSSTLDASLDNLDAHLPAWTQVDERDEYPLYYAYYGTRVNYLRGGFAWNAWRRAMIEQLIHWQKPDGSFPLFAKEDDLHARYGAALAAMITRICLEDVPAYLKVEAKGF